MNDRVVWQERVAGKRVGWRKVKPPSSKVQSLSRASHKGKRNQKIVKNGRQTVQANHGKRMSSRQILDICGRKARTRPIPHQPIPSQYRTRWDHGSEVRGHGLVVGRGKRPIFEVPVRALLGEVSYWDDIPPKRSKTKLKPLGAYHEG